jgi:hypothetical protein
MPRSTPSIMIASIIIEGTSALRIGRERDMTFENVLPERESLLYPDINQQHNCFIPRSDMKLLLSSIQLLENPRLPSSSIIGVYFRA